MSSFTYKLKKLQNSIEFDIQENNNLIDLISNENKILVLEITNLSTDNKSAQVYLSIPTSLNSLSDNKFLIKSSSTTIIEKQLSGDLNIKIKERSIEINEYENDLRFGILNSFITPIINANSTKSFLIKINATNSPFIGAFNIEVE